jgi:hypothetical protein
MICVLLVALGELQVNPGAGTIILFFVTCALGLAMGVALAKERRTPWIVLAVPMAALLGTMVLGAGGAADQSSDGFEAGLVFEFLVVILGFPVIAGALLGAMWRMVVRLVARRSTHEESEGRPERSRLVRRFPPAGRPPSA